MNLLGSNQRKVKRFLVNMAKEAGRPLPVVIDEDLEFAAEHFGLPRAEVIEQVLDDPEFHVELFTPEGNPVSLHLVREDEEGNEKERITDPDHPANRKRLKELARAAYGLNPKTHATFVVRHRYAPHRAGKRTIAKRLATYGALGYLISRAWAYLLLLLKLGGKGKSLWSMLIMVGVYAMFWGWPFAAGFVALLFVHEMGHAYVLRREGIKAGLPVFIPFMGAVIAMKEMPRNAWVEAKVGIGGPVLGTIGALVCVHIHSATDDLIWQALAYIGFMLNLFNMLPVSPMDGGRVVNGVSRILLAVGYVAGWLFFIFGPTVPILLLILLLGGMEVYRAFKKPIEGYYDIKPWQRVTMGVCYVALTGFLLFAMTVTFIPEASMSAAQGIALNLGPLIWAIVMEGHHVVSRSAKPNVVHGKELSLLA